MTTTTKGNPTHDAALNASVGVYGSDDSLILTDAAKSEPFLRAGGAAAVTVYLSNGKGAESMLSVSAADARTLAVLLLNAAADADVLAERKAG